VSSGCWRSSSWGRGIQSDIAWETEVWLADILDHLIHFNGDRFFGPPFGLA